MGFSASCERRQQPPASTSDTFMNTVHFSCGTDNEYVDPRWRARPLPLKHLRPVRRSALRQQGCCQGPLEEA